MSNYDAPNTDHDAEKIDHDDHTSPSSSSSRAPQLNSAIPGHGGYEGGQNINGDGNIDSAGSFQGRNYAHDVHCHLLEDDNMSDDDYSPIQGQEGLEAHQIEFPGLGWISLEAVYTALARHERCTCHRGLLPDEYPFSGADTPMISGTQSPTSMLANYGSGEHSMESSMIFSTRSASPAVYLAFVGEMFQPESTGSLFTSAPLSLVPDLLFARDIERAIYHPIDISISEDDHSEYDIW